MPVCIGLDLSLRSTGFVAIRCDGAILRAQSFGASLDRSATVGMKINRILSIVSRILSEFDAVKAVADGEVRVAIENYAYGARGSQNDLAELHGVVKATLFSSRKVAPHLPSPAQCRKVVFGSGRTTKAEAFKLAHLVLTNAGHECMDNDVADAYAVAEWLRLTTT
jgi:Holliday junction resolvasome RuvABC endonuclease subunit